MKFVKIMNYVKYSFEGKPSFVLLMSDGKEYISNGCVFVEKAQKNIDKIIKKYDCGNYLDELFEEPSIDISELVDGYGMFWGCKELSEFTHDMPNLENGEWMFFECSKLTKFTSELTKLEYGNGMFIDCTQLTEFTRDFPNLKCDISMIDN